MAIPHNQRISFVARCPSCAEPNGKHLVIKRNKYKSGMEFTDLCSACKQIISNIAATLAAGGVLVRCQCGAFTALPKVPAEAVGDLTKMPNGPSVLKIPSCTMCRKEGADASADAVQGDNPTS